MFIRSLSLFFYSGLAFAATAPTFPALTYSTYLRDSFTPNAIATDSSGNIYLAGNAIVDPSTSQTTVLVVKLNPQASQYLYVRYLGGSVNDNANAIAVDSAGDAYVAGVTTSPDFPVTSGGNLGTAPTTGTERSYVAKLDPDGQLVFSDLLGGSTNSYPQAVAVNAAGQVLVSGISVGSGFPSTPGVYSVANTAFSPYLLELDPTGTKIVFSATGIGGNAITFDSSGNIYMAGTTSSLTYPTTPGSYQPAFPVFQTCFAPCTGSFQGPNQYVTKLDPTGSKLIFSTAVSGTGNTVNEGLAVDAAGNVYLTGLAGAGYPFTVVPPAIPLGPALAALATPALPFLSKLDPAGQKLLFSVPVGGLGVQVDANGFAYVGGIIGLMANYDVAANLPALASLPTACLLAQTTIGKSAYTSQVDASSGNVLGSQFIGGTTLAIAGVALSGSTLWIAGATNLPNFPFSPNALTSSKLGPNPLPGAYLGAVDFSAPAFRTTVAPQIGCIVDAANLAPAGPVVPYQLLTIFGTGLGPAAGAVATDNATTMLGGVSVTFGSLVAPLLYVSSNQINLAVPLVPEGPSGTVMQVTVNGVSSPPLQFPVTSANPSLFVNIPAGLQTTSQEFIAVALNANGSLNSPSNPAQPGSVISVFVNGLAMDPEIPFEPPQLYTGGGWSVMDYSQTNPFVLEVHLQIPSSPTTFDCQPANASVCTATFEIFELNSYLTGSQLNSTGGLAFGGEVYVTQ
jgi:uncharacterized protein (TIGR03437 family)